MIKCATLPIPKENLSWYLLEGFRKSAFHIVPHNKIKPYSDCVLENDVLCVQTKRLTEFVETATPYKNFSAATIFKNLELEGAIATIDSHGEKRHATKKDSQKKIS